jgi:hypothetical protein
MGKGLKAQTQKGMYGVGRNLRKKKNPSVESANMTALYTYRK